LTLAQSATAAPSAPVVAAICAAEILGLAGFSIVPALLPQFIEAWSLTNTQAGWLAGITFVLRFARDSLLEGDGFELSVPGQRRHPSATANHTKVGDT
jgi:hypothetical protein